MNSKPVIFVGSSLPLAEAAAMLDADYRPPVKRAAIDALLGDPPPAIGIIDGEFFQSLAISPKEILRALERGIPVWGASSMGALRAVELAPYGMMGVGTVFELYDSGRIDADDEVAVTYAPGDYRPLSEAMVNMRLALERAAEAGAISAASCARLTRIAKSMYFPERSYPNLWKKAAGQVAESELANLRRFLAEHRPDVKREDARLLILQMRAAPAAYRTARG